MRTNLKDKVGQKVVVFGTVDVVQDKTNQYGKLLNICLSDVKVQEGKTILGREDHVWINSYESRNNEKVLMLKDVEEGARVGIRGVVREYTRRDGTTDYDFRDIDAIKF